jgi:hypothetical protein
LLGPGGESRSSRVVAGIIGSFDGMAHGTMGRLRYSSIRPTRVLF